MRDSSLTAKTLSRWLRSSGTLPRGTVADVSLELEFETPISRLVFLTATSFGRRNTGPAPPLGRQIACEPKQV